MWNYYQALALLLIRHLWVGDSDSISCMFQLANGIQMHILREPLCPFEKEWFGLMRFGTPRIHKVIPASKTSS
jgi:hypothetical protein